MRIGYLILKFKCVLIGLILATVLFLFGGCSSGVLEGDVRADIIKWDSYFSYFDLDVDSYQITKRQTNIEDKNDFVWASISGSNDDFSYYADYMLEYRLYNDGWILEYANCLNSGYTALCSPQRIDENGYGSDSYLLNKKPGGSTNVDYEFLSSTQYGNEATIVYTYTYYGSDIQYVDSTYRYTFDAEYNPFSGWTFSGGRSEFVSRKVAPDRLIGKYTASMKMKAQPSSYNFDVEIDVDDTYIYLYMDIYYEDEKYAYESIELRIDELTQALSKMDASEYSVMIECLSQRYYECYLNFDIDGITVSKWNHWSGTFAPKT